MSSATWPYTLLAEFRVKEGKLEQIRKHLKTLVDYAEAHTPQDVLKYTITVDKKDMHSFKVWEEFDSEQAFKEYAASSPFAQLKNELPNLLEGGLNYTVLERI